MRDGSRFGPMAPQNVGTLEAMLGGGAFEQSEDCLHLSVTTPAVDDGGRPVMVWIHGGGFQTGSGSLPWYHGTRLAQRHGVVVASINYRLGALGFSHLGALGEAYAGSGNAGILDQIAALEWVHENIAGFGGDAENVTIFGESAGAMSVGTLLGAPAALELFHRAVAQSGACQAISTVEQATGVAERMAEHFGSYEAMVEAPAGEVLAAQRKIAGGMQFAPDGPLLPFQPVVDGVVLPIHPLDAVAAGAAAEVDLLAGTNAHEFTLFTVAFPVDSVTNEDLEQKVAQVAGGRASEVIDAYRRIDPEATPADLLVAISTDLVFRLPCEALLAAHDGAAVRGSTRSYIFTYESPALDGRLRSTHALEIPFVFGMIDHPGNELFVGPIDDDTRALGDICAQAWTSFAATGVPSADDAPGWPEWDAGRRATFELGLSRQVLDDPGAGTRLAWGA